MVFFVKKCDQVENMMSCKVACIHMTDMPMRMTLIGDINKKEIRMMARKSKENKQFL